MPRLSFVTGAGEPPASAKAGGLRIQTTDPTPEKPAAKKADKASRELRLLLQSSPRRRGGKKKGEGEADTPVKGAEGVGDGDRGAGEDGKGRPQASGQKGQGPAAAGENGAGEGVEDAGKKMAGRPPKVPRKAGEEEAKKHKGPEKGEATQG
jgi:hypothetical protein